MPPSAVVVVVDRLQSGLLGPYGATWVRTPALNALAAQSFTLDQMLIDSPRLEDIYGGYLSDPPTAPRSSLLAELSQRGVHTALLTDDPAIASLGSVGAFAEIVSLPAADAASTASSLEETQLGRFFAAAADWIARNSDDGSGDSTLLWLHTRGLALPWDAPLELRNQYRDEEDPAPPEFIEPPNRMLQEDCDPDEVLGVVHAYAGQVSLLDACLAVLLGQLAESPLGKQSLVVVTGARGFPLGEHRRLGACDEPLYEELIHVPCFLRFPDRQGAAGRSDALTQPADLAATLREWFGGEINSGTTSLAGRSLLPIVRTEQVPLRDRLCGFGAGGEAFIRTPGWQLRRSPTPAEKKHLLGEIVLELFAKPADRSEVNEVSARAPEVTTGLEAALLQFQAGRDSGGLADLPPLDDNLVRPAE